MDTFRALRHRTFRRFFVAQAASILGSWMQQIALSWLVYRTTGSALLLGLVAFANQAPILFFAPFSGLLADRFDRRRLLILTQSFAAAQAALLALLTLSGSIETWHIVTLSVVYGIAMGMDMPVRHSLFVEMVTDRADLPNAIALNSFLMNGGRLIGPSIAGVALLYVDEGFCFTANALSYLGVLWVAWTLPRAARKTAPVNSSLLAALTEAASYAWSDKMIRYLLMLVAAVGFFGSSYIVLMPVFAKDVFGGGAETLGFLVGCAGFGAVLGTGYLAARASILGLDTRLVFTSVLAGCALAAVGASKLLWLSYLLMTCVGFGIIVTAASTNMILQSVVPDDKRGRIVSFYAMAFLGVMPFGALTAGGLAGRVGAPITAMLFGAGCVFAGLLFGGLLRRSSTLE